MTIPKAGDKGYIYDTWEVEKRQVSQAAAGYNPYGATGGKGCASCQWYIPRSDACVLVQGDISPTGLSNFYTPIVVEETPPLLVKLVDSKSLTARKQIAEKEGEESGGLIGRFKGFWNELWGTDPDNALNGNKAFSVFRTKEGDLRFFVVYSNIFEDKEKEIFSTKAHEEYVDWVSKQPKEFYPELQIWHCGPGSAIGKGDFVDFVDGFAVGSGLIFKEYEAVAIALATKETGVSHGYVGIQGVEGANVYSLYRTFEWTALPDEKAANEWTDYRVGIKELEMGFKPEKKAYLKQLGFQDPEINEMEVKLAAFTKTLKDSGINFKENGGTEEPVITPPETPTSAPIAPVAVVAPVQVALTPDQAFLKELSASLQTSNELVGALASTVKELQAEVKQLKTPIEDQVADMLTARIEKNPSNAGFVASASVKNLENSGKTAVVGDQDNPDFNWFFKEVLGPMDPNALAAANAAASTNGQAPIPAGANG